MKTWKSICIMGAIGVALVGAVVITGTKDVGEVNKEAYATYLNECDNLKKLGFENFTPESTKVRFFDGDNDFVVNNSNEWKKENPVLNVIAGTIWQVGEEYQALIPVYEKMQGLTEVAEGVSILQDGVKNSEVDNGITNRQKNITFSENMYVSTICHEVFHSWQFSNFEDQIVEGAQGYTGDREAIIVAEIDNNEEMAASVEREVNFYREAYFTEDIDAKKELICEAVNESRERAEKLSDTAKFTEYYLTTLEGSAQYVEAMSYRDLSSEEEYEAQYLGEFVYSGGSGKYYTIGLYQCLLLDQLDVDWQEGFSFENSPSTILENMVE